MLLTDDFQAATAAWSSLQNTACCTPYQTLSWARAWCDTVGRASGAGALIAVVSDADGRPAALLPLTKQNWMGLKLASFIGAKDSNGNLGLFAEPSAWTRSECKRLLRHIATSAGVDLFALRNQPAQWNGEANPLLLLPHQPSPSGGRTGQLVANPQRPLELRLSKHARKLLRQKATRLQRIGPVEYRRAGTQQDLDAIVAAHVEQRIARASVTGVPPPTAVQVDFLRRGAASETGHAPFEWYALWCGSDIVATFAGTGHRGRFSGMVVAFDSRPEYASCSPAELLIQHVMADLRQRGFSDFDLGIGEARYKNTFCDTTEPLFDCFVGYTHVGQSAALLLGGLGRAKRFVKRSPRVYSALRRLRRTIPQRLNRP